MSKFNRESIGDATLSAVTSIVLVVVVCRVSDLTQNHNRFEITKLVTAVVVLTESTKQ